MVRKTTTKKPARKRTAAKTTRAKPKAAPKRKATKTAKTGRMKLDVGRAILKGKRLTARQKKIRDNMKSVYKRKDGIMTIEAPGYGAISIFWRNDMWKGEYIGKKGEIV